MLSWLAPEPISREIFTDHRAAVNELIDYSMIRWDAGTNMLQVHRLVQEISRSRIPADERSASLQAALHAINTAAPTAPDDVRPWPVWNLLRPHVSELIAHADQNGITDPTVRLMNDMGTLLWAKAMHGEAEPLMRRALAIDEQSCGAEHPDIAIDLNNLAQLLQKTNRLAEAEPLMRRALTIFEISLGPDHPSTQTVARNYALLREAQQ